jgi:hypothetical protein
MHLRTYQRLCGKSPDHEMKRDAILAVQLRRLRARSDRFLARVASQRGNDD